MSIQPDAAPGAMAPGAHRPDAWRRGGADEGPPAARPAPPAAGAGVGANGRVGARAPARVVGRTVVLLLADIAPAARLWGYARFVLGPRAWQGTPGLGFAKVLGSGFEGGFGLRPSGSRQGVLAAFDSDDAAQAFLASPRVTAYRDHAREFFAARLQPYSARGSWSGCCLQPSAQPPEGGEVAALTRASIRPWRAARFWRMAPAAQAGLEQAPGCRLAAGLGEAPLLRQATFSIWDSAAAMEAYARSGDHGAAARASYQQGFFSESMFVRFLVAQAQGSYKGRRFG